MPSSEEGNDKNVTLHIAMSYIQRFHDFVSNLFCTIISTLIQFRDPGPNWYIWRFCIQNYLHVLVLLAPL